jgi:hypothetical protein
MSTENTTPIYGTPVGLPFVSDLFQEAYEMAEESLKKSSEANEKYDACVEATAQAQVAANKANAIRENIEAGGYIESLKELNNDEKFSIWIGTSAQYTALETKIENCLYIITDDTTGDALQEAIEKLFDNTRKLAYDNTILSEEIENMKNEKNKVLWTGTAEVSETNARAEITVPNISKYKMLDIDGNVYTLQGDGAFYNSVEGTRRNFADGSMWFVIDVRCLWIATDATDKVYLRYESDNKVGSLARTMFKVEGNTTTDAPEVAFITPFSIHKIIGIM